MKNKYRNIFLGFGIIAVVIMLFTFDMSYEELWSSLNVPVIIAARFAALVVYIPYQYLVMVHHHT